jgi:hypothetical protein
MDVKLMIIVDNTDDEAIWSECNGLTFTLCSPAVCLSLTDVNKTLFEVQGQL